MWRLAFQRPMWPPPAGSAPITIDGNGVASAHLAAGSGETNFVGGFGSQVLFGGQGVNILTYLAMGDGGDYDDRV